MRSVVSAFVVAFALPYLISAIGVNIGWLFGGISLFAAAYSYLFVPETKVKLSDIRTDYSSLTH